MPPPPLLLSLLLPLLLLVPTALAFPSGPPESACKTLKPGTQVGALELEGHVTLPQNQHATYGNRREPPFYITVWPDDREWVPGRWYTVNVVANQSEFGNYYRGLLLQAREVKCMVNNTDILMVEDDLMGEFSINVDPTKTLLKYMECDDKDRATVSHKTPQLKINETMQWKAPDSDDHGDIVFIATVVKKATVYWTNLHSHVLRRRAMIPPAECGCAMTSCAHLLVLVTSLAAFLLSRR